eukprot:1283855-Prymnesium_polylepis.1
MRRVRELVECGEPRDGVRHRELLEVPCECFRVAGDIDDLVEARSESAARGVEASAWWVDEQRLQPIEDHRFHRPARRMRLSAESISCAAAASGGGRGGNERQSPAPLEVNARPLEPSERGNAHVPDTIRGEVGLREPNGGLGDLRRDDAAEVGRERDREAAVATVELAEVGALRAFRRIVRPAEHVLAHMRIRLRERTLGLRVDASAATSDIELLTNRLAAHHELDLARAADDSHEWVATAALTTTQLTQVAGGRQLPLERRSGLGPRLIDRLVVRDRDQRFAGRRRQEAHIIQLLAAITGGAQCRVHRALAGWPGPNALAYRSPVRMRARVTAARASSQAPFAPKASAD